MEKNIAENLAHSNSLHDTIFFFKEQTRRRRNETTEDEQKEVRQCLEQSSALRLFSNMQNGGEMGAKMKTLLQVR